MNTDPTKRLGLWIAGLALALIAGLIGLCLVPTERRPRPPRPAEPVPAQAAPAAPATEPAKPPPADRNFNPGWVGALCAHDKDCAYPGGFCLMPEEGYPRGHCSAACQNTCPDRQGALYSPTFCIEDPLRANRGLCVAGCNLHLTPSGCRPGYSCGTVERLGHGPARLVCLPERGTPPPPTPCTDRLDTLGIVYTRPDLADAPSRAAKSGDPLPREKICQIDTPVLLANPIHQVLYRQPSERYGESLLVACPMACALEKLSRFLQELSVVEVLHLGTYNCRGIAGSRELSNHGRAMAIDLIGFERAQGSPVSVKDDYPGNNPERRAFLRSLLQKLRSQRIFDRVLGPDTDSAHRDHLHLEVRASP